MLVRTLSDPLQSVDEEEAAAAMLCSSLYVPLLPVVDQPGAVKRISTETMRQVCVPGTTEHDNLRLLCLCAVGLWTGCSHARVSFSSGTLKAQSITSS